MAISGLRIDSDLREGAHVPSIPTRRHQVLRMPASTWLALPILLALLAWSSTAGALTLTVVNGQLLGASNVDVGGTLYDVDFVDGTCVALFGGCDVSGPFIFSTQASRTMAAQALLDQVFVDGPLGAFDSTPDLTNGCEFADHCEVRIPSGIFAPTGDFGVQLAFNDAGNNDLNIDLTFAGDVDTTGLSHAVFAVFSVAPEPGVGALLSAALLGGSLVAGEQRSKRERSARGR